MVNVWDMKYKGKKTTLKGKKGYSSAKAQADKKFGKKVSLYKNIFISRRIKKLKSKKK